ncbi:MAG: bacteriohemerythrin [Bacteroidota bacterium]
MITQMDVPKWNNKYLTHIEEIDYQHKYFLGLIRRFQQKINDSMSDYIIERHLNEIVKYAQFHFFSEENLMMLINYPDVKHHQELHNEIIERLATRVNTWKSNEQSLEKILPFMIDWFFTHTVEEDKKIADFMLKKCD